MPVIPEKRQLDAQVQGALGAQFWGQPIHSARVISGSTCTVPCEPPPLPLTAPSGLARTQLLVAAHAVGAPLFPAWCEEHGGAVFDRVLLQSGRPRWWWALTGRLKAQRMIGQRATHTLRDTLSDPDNYALAANGRLLLSKATTLRAHLQADSLTQLPASFRGWGGKGHGGDGGGGGGVSSSSGGQDRGMSAALQLKQRLLDGYELTADLAVNEPAVDGVRPWVNTPLRLSVDVAPRPAQRTGPLLYRVGAHGVLAPESAEGGSPHVLAAHMQGALALAGHATLWQAGSKPWQRRTKAEAARGRGNNGRLVAPPASALTASSGPLALPSEAPWPAAATRRRGGVASDGADDDGGAAAARRHAVKPRREGRAGGRDGSPPLVTPGQVQDGLQQTTWRLERLRTDLQSWAGRARAGELLKGPSSKRRGGDARPGGCWSSLLPAPHLRVGGLVGVLGRVPLAHSRFDSGGPASGGGNGSGSGARRRRRRRAAGAAVDADADADALTLGAAAGPPLADDTAGAAGAAAPGSRGAGAAAAWLRHLGGASRGFMEHVVVGGLGGLGGFGSHLAHDVGVRLFAGGGASLQVGQMRRALLDFTRLEATVDLGLTGPRVGGGGGGEDFSQRRGARHPAFGLDGGGAWHALTLSATQQLLGPVRLRADWRMALDSSEALALPRREPGGGAGGGGLGGAARLLGPQAAAQVARHVGGMRPSLLDAAYGLDVVVPGSGGLARGVVWYSPRRGEGGVELRLL